MPVINDNQHPSVVGSHQTTTNSISNHGTYFLFSIAILITLATRLHRRRQQREVTANASSIKQTQKSIFSSAQTMQTPPTSSALPEKPFLPDLESASYDVGLESASRDEFETSRDSDSTTSSESPPDLTKAQLVTQDATFSHFHRQDDTMQRSVSVHLPKSRRPGSLIHPEPPTPTISMKEPNMTIQTQFPRKPAQEYHFEDLQPEYQAQYIHNEILFVPSPTEYTSYEALYSKFPAPIYHEPNPTSYTSISDSEVSEAESRSYTTSSFSSEPNTNHQHSQDFPRRRSYTKTLRNGSEMSGEIVISGGSGEGHASRQWRRHTKVFGGGICMACEESEGRRMSA